LKRALDILERLDSAHPWTEQSRCRYYGVLQAMKGEA
jgi:hypothetical protein